MRFPGREGRRPPRPASRRGRGAAGRGRRAREGTSFPRERGWEIPSGKAKPHLPVPGPGVLSGPCPNTPSACRSQSSEDFQVGPVVQAGERGVVRLCRLRPKQGPGGGVKSLGPWQVLLFLEGRQGAHFLTKGPNEQVWTALDLRLLTVDGGEQMARIGFCGSGAGLKRAGGLSWLRTETVLPIELPWFLLPEFSSHPDPVVQSTSKVCPFCL